VQVINLKFLAESLRVLIATPSFLSAIGHLAYANSSPWTLWIGIAMCPFMSPREQYPTPSFSFVSRVISDWQGTRGRYPGS
jgi:hypothetical protein